MVNGKRRRLIAYSQEEAERLVAEISVTRHNPKINKILSSVSDEMRLDGAIYKGIESSVEKPSLQSMAILKELLKIKKIIFGFPFKKEETLMTKEEVAEMLNIPVNALPYLRRECYLPYISLAKRERGVIRYEKPAIKRWIELRRKLKKNKIKLISRRIKNEI